MSLGLDFTFYDAEGNEVGFHPRFAAVTLYQDYSDMTMIHRNFFEIFDHQFYGGPFMEMVRDPNRTRYAVPRHIPSFMFDLKDRSLLPNRFNK